MRRPIDRVSSLRASGRSRPWAAVWFSVVAVVAVVTVAAQPAPDGRGGALLPGEWIAGATSADAWRAVVALPPKLGLRVWREERATGSLVTAPGEVTPAVFGPLDAAGLPAAPTRTRVQLHLHVMPGLEPARLGIGVVTDTDAGGVMSKAGRTQHAVRRFGNAVIAARVLRELEAALGVTAEPLAAAPAARAAQARRLLPAGIDGGCGIREAVAASPALAVERPPARTKYEVPPAYPRGALEGKRGGAVEVRAQLSEHGTVVEMELTGAATLDDELARAAFGAFALWRFSPLVQGGCPARVGLTLRSRFRAE